MADAGKYVAAICAAPSIILGGMGLLEGKKATCYPGMEDGMTGATRSKANAVTDGKIITGCGRRRTGFRVRADYRAVRQPRQTRSQSRSYIMCTDKKTLRGAIFAERASLSAEEKQAIDRGIAQNILQSEFYQQADCIFCYVSTAEEIDTRTVLENALASGRTVCVPLCGKGGSMTARKITALSELQTGHYGILSRPTRRLRLHRRTST